MGNSASSEKPTRAPQKLSKPRVGNHASTNTPTTVKDGSNRLNNTQSNVSIHGQHQNSHNTVSLYPLPLGAAEPPHIAVTAVQGELGVAEVPETDDGGPLSRHSKRLSGLVRSVSYKSQPNGVACGQSVGSPSKAFIGMVRPKSVVQASTIAPSSTSQSRPVSSDGTDSRGSSVRLQYSSDGHCLEQAPGTREAGRLVASTEPSTATHSDGEKVSYLPRRSSFGQTPGAATRLLPLPSEPQFVTRESFRRSFPLAEGPVNYHSPKATMDRRQSMPIAPFPSSTEEKVRASTPSEGDYRQLGGIRFGSLRITNDTSVSSEDDVPNCITAMQWPITSDFRKPGRTEGLDLVTPPVEDTVKPVDEDPGSNGHAALQQLQAHHLSASQPAVNRADKDAEENLTDSSDSSTSSEDRSFDEHDQQRQLCVPLSNLDSGYVSSSSVNSDTNEIGRTSAHDQPMGRPTESPTGQGTPSNLSTNSAAAQESYQAQAGSSTLREQVSDVQRQHSFRARGSAMLSSLLSRRPRDSRSMTIDQSSSRSCASSTHSRGASLPDASLQDEDSADAELSLKSDDRANEPGKLKRLLKSRRRSLPQESTYIIQDTTPMPSDAEDKLKEHGFHVIQTTVTKPALRMEQSRDTLKTIVSVGSREDKDEANNSRSPSSGNSGLVRSQPTEHQPTTRKPLSINRTRSLLYPKSSSRQAKSTLRKSMPVVLKSATTKVDPVDEDLAETVQIWGYEAHMASIASIRHMAGNSAFDQAFVPMSRDNGAYPIPINMTPPSRERSLHKSQSGRVHQPLRTRYSAPDFLETVCEPASPGGIDSTQQKPPKTPPPVSLRTRGSKRSRRRARSQHHSHRSHPQYVPPVPPLDMPEVVGEQDQDFSSSRRLSQSLRSFPVQPPQKTLAGPRHVYGGYTPPSTQTHFSKPRYHGHHSSWNETYSGYHHPPSVKVHHGYKTATQRVHPIQSL